MSDHFSPIGFRIANAEALAKTIDELSDALVEEFRQGRERHLRWMDSSGASLKLASNAFLPIGMLGTTTNISAAAQALLVGRVSLSEAIFEAADMLDLNPGSADTLRYLADRAEDLARSRGALDGVYNGPDGTAGTADDFDAILASGNSQAGTAAKVGYPSVTVPGGFVPASGAVVNPFPSNVTFTGRAFSEPRLIGLAYAFEQATRHRVPPASTPPLPTDTVRRQ